MTEEYSLLRYVVELEFVSRLNNLKWYQFNKRREARCWRDEQLKTEK